MNTLVVSQPIRTVRIVTTQSSTLNSRRARVLTGMGRRIGLLSHPPHTFEPMNGRAPATIGERLCRSCTVRPLTGPSAWDNAAELDTWDRTYLVNLWVWATTLYETDTRGFTRSDIDELASAVRRRGIDTTLEGRCVLCDHRL
jgi:hypothetical protein